MQSRVQSYPKIPAHRKDQMLRIWGGAQDMHVILQALHYLDCHAPTGAIDRMLGALVANGLTGDRFAAYLKHECAGSHLELQRNLLMMLAKTKTKPRLIAGNDFLV